jgi:ATP-dependent Clp protease ATP-binding subunit ClpA
MLSKELNTVFDEAVNLARDSRHEYITIEHVFYTLLLNDDVVHILKKCNVNINQLKIQIKKYLDNSIVKLPASFDMEPSHTVALSNVINSMLSHLRSAEKENATPNDFLVAIFDEERSFCVTLLRRAGIDRFKVIDTITNKQNELKITIHRVDPNGNNPAQKNTATAKHNQSQQQKTGENKEPSYLETYSTDLVKMATEGKLDPLIGREIETQRVMQILCRRKKNNPILVGEAGVGKTAVVEGVAAMIAEGNVPEILKESRLLALDTGSLVSGTKYRGDFEKRLKGVLDEIKSVKNAILFIDEIHTIIGAGASGGGNMDLSNLIKPALSNGELKCIGATTYDEFKTVFDKDKALSRRFAKIDVDEPSIDDSYKILVGLKERYEKHHGLKYPNSVLKKSVELSKRFINDRFLPDSAIDLIDETGASFHLNKKNKKTVSIKDIENILAKMANIPSRQVSTDDKEHLKELEKSIKKEIFSQDEAVESIVKAIKKSRAGLSTPNRPVGAFLFTGPTGVGKTEVAKSLATHMGVEFIRFDMSEYMEEHAVSKLIGSPPGYVGHEEGGLLTDEIRKHPHSVLLLDEIEKANATLINILLQVFDNATLTDNTGAKADFRNVIIIMTSNLGTKSINQMGFSKESGFKEDKAIKDFFSTEFINRLDSIVRFNHLEKETTIKIVEKLLMEVETQLSEKNIKITATKAAKQALSDEGYSEEFGARFIARVIDNKIKDVITDEILFGALQKGGSVTIDYKEDQFIFRYA